MDAETGSGAEPFERDGDEVVLQGDPEGVGIGGKEPVAKGRDGAARAGNEDVEDDIGADVQAVPTQSFSTKPVRPAAVSTTILGR